MADRLQRRRRRRKRIADLYRIGWRVFYTGDRPHRQSREPLRRVWRFVHDDFRGSFVKEERGRWKLTN